MSVEDEKKPRKTPVKKAAAGPKEGTAAKKVKAEAAPKAAAAPKKKTAAKSVNGASAAKPISESETVQASQRKSSPTYMQIAERAYGYFVARGGKHGYHEEDWYRAEQELWSNS